MNLNFIISAALGLFVVAIKMMNDCHANTVFGCNHSTRKRVIKPFPPNFNVI